MVNEDIFRPGPSDESSLHPQSPDPKLQRTCQARLRVVMLFARSSAVADSFTTREDAKKQKALQEARMMGSLDVNSVASYSPP